jgi:membrane protein YdbS with pleckstrin-like domain
MSDQPSEPSTASPIKSSSGPADRVREQLTGGQLAGQQAAEDDVETKLWEGGFSPKAMLGTWLILGITTVLTLVVVSLYALDWIGWALVGLVALWGIVGCTYAARRLGMHYELTTQRFLHQSGVLSRRTDRIEVIDIDDVSFHQGPVERALGVGTITIESSDRSHPMLHMKGIAGVREVAGLIDDIRRKERRRRSLHIEAI